MSCPFHRKKKVEGCQQATQEIPSPSFWLQTKAAVKLLFKSKIEEILEVAFQECGPIFTARSIVFMKGNEALQFLFTADPEFIQRGPLAEDGPKSLATMDGSTHITHKRFVLQAFKKNWLLKYAEKTKLVVLNFVRELNHEMDLERDMMQLSSNLILNTLLGLTQEDENFQSFIRDYNLISNRGPKKTSSHSPYQKAMVAMPRLWSLIDKLMRERLSQPSGDILTAFNVERGAFPDLEDQDTLNYIYMLAEFGQEDLGAILTFAIAELSFRPEIKKKLLIEISQFDLDDVDIIGICNLTFVQNFVRELERLYPPVSYFLRYSVKDYSYNNYKINKGVKLFGSIFHTHRDPNIFKSPLEFKPERFEDKDQGAKEIRSVIGFGGGFHMCPAKQFIYMQVALVLFFLLKTCDFEQSQIEPEIHYAPKASLKKKIIIKVKKL